MPWNYSGVLPREPRVPAVAGNCPVPATAERVLVAGDSWAQYLWDDDAHNLVFDRFGHADKFAISRSLGDDPGPGHTGPEYAVSGSEARQWVDTANYPWIANVVAELQALPSIDHVMLSLGGNDILAARPGGGWYKDMDLDVPGSEAALFERILDDLDTIATEFRSVRPGIDVLVSSYEYPNFNVDPLWCWIYACPKREELSRDPVNDLITDVELNAMIVDVEAERRDWIVATPGLSFDHGVGTMHHYYGDGVTAPGALPRPGQLPPDFSPFPGGNPLRPTLRENFRRPLGLDADPIHLDEEGYLYKVALQTETHYFPSFRGEVSVTLESEGGVRDGWTNGDSSGTEAIRVGDDGARLYFGLLSFDTASLPPGAEIAGATLYLLRNSGSGSNPFTSGDLGVPSVDVKTGSFGAPAVEVSDWNEPADAEDAGCLVGSARDEFGALRIDLGAEGIAAINREGLTQFRLQFSAIDTGEDRVDFKDGDASFAAQPPVRLRWHTKTEGTEPALVGSIAHRGVAEVFGSARPRLELRFTGPIFEDGFESGDTSAWSATVRLPTPETANP